MTLIVYNKAVLSRIYSEAHLHKVLNDGHPSSHYNNISIPVQLPPPPRTQKG